MRVFFFTTFFSFFLSLSGLAQISSTADSKYLEDQFYMGLTYNFLLDKPADITQRNLSYGLLGGVIKDIPINNDRTTALGIGLGYAFSSYYSNLRAIKSGNQIAYAVLDDNTRFKRNKIETHMVEMPFQFRWRNSTPNEYKFWRIYTGFKIGYVVGGRSKFVTKDDKRSFYNDDIRKFQYGLTLDLGYNTFNIHIYYALNGLFNDNVLLNGANIQITPLRVGLIFYIL